jgi:hypothetical protein
MDAFDFVDTRERPRSRNVGDLIWNVLTILVLLTTLVVGLIFLILFSNPQSAINPFPPPTLLIPISLSTAAPLGLSLPPTWTPAPSPLPTITDTPGPTPTPILTNTPVGGPPAPTITAGGMSFVIQQGSPQAIQNIYSPEAGCNFLGVGGQALDLSNAEVVGLIVQLSGTLEGKIYETKLSMTGTASKLGRGGFFFQIADHPITSNSTLWIQLLDQQGLPLSDKVYFNTFDDCAKNLIIIYFKQVK